MSDPLIDQKTAPDVDSSLSETKEGSATPSEHAKGSDGNDEVVVISALRGSGRGRPKRLSRRPSGSKQLGRLSDDPQIDNLRPLSLTKQCNIPIIQDLTSERVVCFAGDFVLVNVTPTKLNTLFQVVQNFEADMGGELAALVEDWTEDSHEILARRQKSNDDPFSCSGAVEIFPLSAVASVENHLLEELKSHAFCGFHFTSTVPQVPLVTAWLSVNRKDANHSNHEWDSKKDPKMKHLKAVFVESLPCSINRFDIVVSSAETMQNLHWITEPELAVVHTYPEALQNFECLVLQFLPEIGCPNWNHVNVVFVSNWRIVLSKRGSEDFREFLLENLWYLSRADFEDFLFQIAGSIRLFDGLDALKGGRLIHEILLQGILLEVMLGKDILNCRYDHKRALGMWLHQKPSGQISHLIKDRNGQRHNAEPEINELEQAPSEHSRSPSPPKKKPKRQPPKRPTKKQIPARFTRGHSADTSNHTAGEGNVLSGDDRVTLESLSKSVKTTLEKTVKVQEDLLRENCAQLAGMSKTVTSLVDKVDKMSKKVSVLESTLKDLAKGLEKPHVVPKDHATRSSGLCPMEDESEIPNQPPSRSKEKKGEIKTPLPNPNSSATTQSSDSAPTRKTNNKKNEKQVPASPPTPPPVPPRDSAPAPSGKANKKRKEKPKPAKPLTPLPPSSSDSASDSSESTPASQKSRDDSPPPSDQSDQGGESKRERPIKHWSPQRDGPHQRNGAYRFMAYDPMMLLHQLAASHPSMQQHPNFNYGYASRPPSDSQNHFHGAHWSSANEAGYGAPHPVEYPRAPHDSGHSSKRHNTQQIKEKRHDKKHKPK